MSTLHETKLDPRIAKTKRSMSTAIFQLLETSTFSKITVNDICNLAMVSRTTFYQHFPDKYELLKFGLEQKRKELQDSSADLRSIILGVLGYIMDKRAVFHNLMLDGPNEELMRILSEASVQNLKEDLEKRAALPGTAPAELAAVFLSGGMTSLLIWWVGTNFAMPKEILADHLLAMFESRGRVTP